MQHIQRGVFVDVETTGLNPEEDRITEVAALVFDSRGHVQQAYSSLIYTAHRIPDEVQSLTGITPALLSSRGKTLSEVMARIAEIINGNPLVAYNASFDASFLEAEAARAGILFHPSKIVCALDAARATWPILKRHRLSAVSLYLGTSRSSHRAMPDCLAGLEVYLHSLTETPDTEVRGSNVVISSIDIENLMDCEHGEELTLWTNPDHHSINAYRTNSPPGQGLVASIQKSFPENAWIISAMKSETPPIVTVISTENRGRTLRLTPGTSLTNQS